MTVSVTVSLSSLTGTALAGAYVQAKLITPDVLTDGVVPKVFAADGETDASGNLTLALYANTLTDAVSYYRVRAWHPTTGKKVLDRAVCVPQWDCSLSDLEHSAWPPTGAVCTVASEYPTTDTGYLFVPFGVITISDVWEGYSTTGLLILVEGAGYSIVPGYGGLWWRLSAEADDMAAAANVWIPGRTNTISALESGGVTTGYFPTALGTEETSLLASESAYLSLVGETPQSLATFTKYASPGCASTDYGQIAIRDLPAFQISDGAGTTFSVYPSFIASYGAPVQVDCAGGTYSYPDLVCRAYPV
jgi:hypothetical protein